MLPDVRELDGERRAALAWKIHEARDFTLPELQWFNSSPCGAHEAVTRGCTDCGVVLDNLQRVGAAWMYMDGSCMLADTTGFGKTVQCAAMLAMCRQTGELSASSRAVVVCRAAAVGQWAAELRRLIPAVPVIAVAGGDPGARVRAYLGPWEVAVVSDRTFAPAGGPNPRDGDVETLLQFPVTTLLYDDLDPMRNPDTATAVAIRRMADACSRVHCFHATPLQKRLEELHSQLRPLGGEDVFGPLPRFRRKYVRRSSFTIQVPDKKDPTGRRTRSVKVYRDKGVREHELPEFRDKLAPFVLRRTAADLPPGAYPEVRPNTVFLDLSPAQKARYEELKKGVLRRLREGGEEVSRVEAAQAFTRGAQICSGLAALDDGADISAKLDWVVDKVTGDLAADKVVCFVYFTPNVAALAARLKAEDIGHVLMWSPESDKAERQRRLEQFAADPQCRVLVGTTTIEMSLNLQAARHLIAVDTVTNPARMSQIIGRVRRRGSAYPVVFFHHLLARGTQEEGYPALLGSEQGLADAVWGEDSEVFRRYTPRQLMEMIASA